MTTYYVDFVNGLDANNGLGPDASHASNKPWKTITKLLGATGLASGDTAYLSPAGPFREAVTPAMTSATAETRILGDPGNVQGFKTSGGVLVAPGEVRWTAFTTSDVAAPSTSAMVTSNSRDYLTFQYITFQGGTSWAVGLEGDTLNFVFRDCKFIGGNHSTGVPTVLALTLADTNVSLLFDRCYFFSPTTEAALKLNPATSAAADYDTGIMVQNCVFMSPGEVVLIVPSGAGSFKAGGIDFYNCTIFGWRGIRITTANMSTSIPCTVYNSVILVQDTGLNASTSGQIVEDYNLIHASTARTNVTAGSNSISTRNYGLLMHVGEELLYGFQGRPVFMPTPGSPLLARGAQAGGPTVDIRNRARPSGGASTSYAWGAYERHDTAARETSTVHTGSNAIVITGPGDHDFGVPVDATSTTVTVFARYDTDHAATNKPQMTILNGEEIGVTTATATMTAAVDTWEQLSLNFSPTAKGIVTIRLISRSAAGSGKAFFDTFAY